MGGQRDRNSANSADELGVEDVLMHWALAPIDWLWRKLPPWGMYILFGWTFLSTGAVRSRQLPWPPTWRTAVLFVPTLILLVYVSLMIARVGAKIFLWPFRMARELYRRKS
jgi:hypothetical protein